MAMTNEELMAELARLQAENKRLQDLRTRGIMCKVSDKGALSVYGLGRFPVTLYKSQWQRLLEYVDIIKEFLTAHASELKDKPSEEQKAE